jgi:hypothetical protein
VGDKATKEQLVLGLVNLGNRGEGERRRAWGRNTLHVIAAPGL